MSMRIGTTSIESYQPLLCIKLAWRFCEYKFVGPAKFREIVLGRASHYNLTHANPVILSRASSDSEKKSYNGYKNPCWRLASLAPSSPTPEGGPMPAVLEGQAQVRRLVVSACKGPVPRPRVSTRRVLPSQTHNSGGGARRSPFNQYNPTPGTAGSPRFPAGPTAGTTGNPSSFSSPPHPPSAPLGAARPSCPTRSIATSASCASSFEWRRVSRAIRATARGATREGGRRWTRRPYCSSGRRRRPGYAARRPQREGRKVRGQAMGNGDLDTAMQWRLVFSTAESECLRICTLEGQPSFPSS